ncbi:MAG: hypothetical protein MUE49_05690 [Rhodospirillales bacterium]|jgi:hypothetical protein|nr:hypothetical protein [Rhodospirillales bacterium]
MTAPGPPAALQCVLEMVPPALADFLATDVRRDVERCDELLAGLAAAAAGEPFEAYGNVYELTADAGRAVLRNSHDPEADEIHLSLTAIVNLLRAWREAVLQASADAETDTARS